MKKKILSLIMAMSILIIGCGCSATTEFKNSSSKNVASVEDTAETTFNETEAHSGAAQSCRMTGYINCYTGSTIRLYSVDYKSLGMDDTAVYDAGYATDIKCNFGDAVNVIGYVGENSELVYNDDSIIPSYDNIELFLIEYGDITGYIGTEFIRTEEQNTMALEYFTTNEYFDENGKYIEPNDCAVLNDARIFDYTMLENTSVWVSEDYDEIGIVEGTELTAYIGLNANSDPSIWYEYEYYVVKCNNIVRVVNAGWHYVFRDKTSIKRGYDYGDINSYDFLDDATLQSILGETYEQTQTTELELSETGQMAYDFVKAIQTEDYEIAYAMIDAYDTAFMDEATFEWVVTRGDFADIIATDDEITEVECMTDDGSYFYYQVTVGTKTFEISAFTNDDNEWKISYFAADATMMVYWYIYVPVGMTVSIDGILLPEEYIWDEEDGMNHYLIESIPIMEHTIVVTSPKYGDYEITLTPEKDEEDIMGRAYPITITYEEDGDGWKVEGMAETDDVSATGND